MRRLHLRILEELARFETKEERNEAITEILELLDEVTEGKLLPEEGKDQGTAKVNPFEGQRLWSS